MNAMTAYELWRALLWHVLRGGGRDAIVITASGHELRELQSVEPQPGWYEVLLQAGPPIGDDSTHG